MSFIVFFVTALIAVSAYYYLRMKKKYRFWKEKGVPSPDPILLFGNTAGMLTMKKHLSVIVQDIYKDFPTARMFGYYDTVKPVLVVKDLGLVEQVLVKDFASYHNRNMFLNEESHSLEVSLFNLTGSKWKAVRNKMVPTFTTGKLRGMFSQMVECFENTLKFIDEGDSDVKGVAGLYATDVIGSCVFGLDIRELGKPESEFRKMGTTLFTLSPKTLVKLLLMKFLPAAAKRLRLTINSPEVLGYLEGIAKEALRVRRQSGATRQDFIQLLLQLLDKGTIEVQTKDLTSEDDYLNTEELYTTESFRMTETLVISQAISFLQAGFEGISVTMAFFCLEMALNSEIQEKLRTEVQEKLRRHGKLTFDAVRDMVYLEMCLQETLRKYPIGSSLSRVTTKNCKLDGVDLPAGISVVIPVLAIHYDPSYYPQPQVFNPDRFHPEAPRVPFSYLPFGEGPRICIGMRFALLELKIGLAMLINKFAMGLSPKTKLPVEFSPKHFALLPKDTIQIQMTIIPS